MKKRLQILLAIVCFGAGLNGSVAQEGTVKSVADDYQEFAYVKTSEVLLEVAEKGFRSQEMLQKLGNSFYFNNEMRQASRWYGELFKLTGANGVDSEYMFRYAMALKGAGSYEKSDEWMAKFNTVNSADSRGVAVINKPDYKETIDDRFNEAIVLKNLDINSEKSDFGTAEVDGDIIFASSRGNGDLYQWNEEPYLDIYRADGDEIGNYFSPREIEGDVNTKYHESIVAYSQDENFMYFTRNNYYKKKKRRDDEGVNRLQMYRASKDEDGEWGDIVPVHFNSDDYSVAHPTVNKAGNRLFFASDMEGSIGQSDIYVVDIKADGSLGDPVNLGPTINTEGQESFPFVNTDGDLYFSSNGWPGLGGKDVFVSKGLDAKMPANASSKFVIENVAGPINSPSDDFAYYENLVTKRAFISSDRPGGKGSDDIYTFDIPECAQELSGFTRNKETQYTISNADVMLLDGDGNEIKKTTSDGQGAFAFAGLDCDTKYVVRAGKEDYIGDEKRLTTPSVRQNIEVELLLEKDVQEVAVCDDLAKTLDIPFIYFDFDKYDIRPDAARELTKVLAVLNKYPTMTIEIRSHTDSRGSDRYNDNLSMNRARSSRQYLLDQDIDGYRITHNGYGEQRLVNGCRDGVTCTEEEHQQNRRSEFIITSLKGKKCEKD